MFQMVHRMFYEAFLNSGTEDEMLNAKRLYKLTCKASDNVGVETDSPTVGEVDVLRVKNNFHLLLHRKVVSHKSVFNQKKCNVPQKPLFLVAVKLHRPSL